jgi:hypothetical protein
MSPCSTFKLIRQYLTTICIRGDRHIIITLIGKETVGGALTGWNLTLGGEKLVAEHVASLGDELLWGYDLRKPLFFE